jgi:osmotically-inducible protein OsmY
MAHDFENIDDLDDLSDAELRALVRDRLAEHRGLDLRDITVQVHNGVVD